MNIMQLCRPDPVEHDPVELVELCTVELCRPDPVDTVDIDTQPDSRSIRPRPRLLTIFLIWPICCISGEGTPKPINLPTGHFLTDAQNPAVRTQEQSGLVWLDNNRIMYQGYDPAQKTGRTEGDIYIWNTTTGEVVRYGEESHFCYAAGTIYMWDLKKWDRPIQEPNPKYFIQNYRYGTIGKEKSGLCKGDSEGNTAGCVGEVNMSCKPVTYKFSASPLGPDSGIEVILREGDGVIIANPDPRRLWNKERKLMRGDILRFSRQEILLLNKQYPKGKPLPIQAVEEIRMRRTTYSEFNGKYVLIGAIPKNGPPGHFTSWPEGMPQPVYVMSRNGEVEIIEVPKLTEWSSIHMASPSRRGLVYWGAHGQTGGGLFIFDGKQNEIIDRGQIGTLAVSPDGCKLAYAIINHYNEFGNGALFDYRIKYMNLCQGS